ncbi:hypothetical protein DINM_002595 [Dirofilaria immitis]|nr:hypothetical protein [Dirofilaria immitis]
MDEDCSVTQIMTENDITKGQASLFAVFCFIDSADRDNLLHSVHEEPYRRRKKELLYLKQFYHLFWLPGINPSKYIFGTYDNSKNLLAIGNIIIYRMVNSSNEDYVRFVYDEDHRAAYGYIFICTQLKAYIRTRNMGASEQGRISPEVEQWTISRLH